MSPAPVVTVTRGKSNPVNLRFHVGSGFHVNSNQPKSEFLIPTALKLSAPTDIVIGRVNYPAGTEMSFAFAPDDKLSVYTGEFPVVVEVRPLAEVIPAQVHDSRRAEIPGLRQCRLLSSQKTCRCSLRSRWSKRRHRPARIPDKARTCTCSGSGADENCRQMSI